MSIDHIWMRQKRKERKVEYQPSTRKNGLDVKYQSRSSWQAIEWTTSIYTFIISTIDNFFLRYDCGTFIYLSIYMVHVYYIHLSNLYCFLLTFRAIYVILFECHHLYCCDMMYIYHTTFLFLCHHWCAFVCLFGHRTIFYYIYIGMIWQMPSLSVCSHHGTPSHYLQC